jgi:hypothetical protein
MARETGSTNGDGGGHRYELPRGGAEQLAGTAGPDGKPMRDPRGPYRKGDTGTQRNPAARKYKSDGRGGVEADAKAAEPRPGGAFTWPEGRPTELARAMAYGIVDPLTRGLVLLTGRRVTVERHRGGDVGYTVGIAGGELRTWAELPEDCGPVEKAIRLVELIEWALENAEPLPGDAHSYLCAGCGVGFDYALGKYGCPNCGGEFGTADLVPGPAAPAVLTAEALPESVERAALAYRDERSPELRAAMEAGEIAELPFGPEGGEDA